jgi:hypothetical protein
MTSRCTILLLLPLLLLPSFATGQAERTFVKSFNLQGRQTVVLNLGDNVQINQWDNDLVRVQMTISIPSTNDGILKSIAESGRYILRNDMTVQSFVIDVPGIIKSMKINGNELKETISYIVFMPKNVTVLKNTDPAVKIVAKLNP